MSPTEPVGDPGPLSGVRCIDLGSWHAGPAAAGMLADLGADVIKVEPPDGDPIRRLRRYHGVKAMLPGSTDGLHFQFANRGKRSVALNLKNAAAQAVLRRLTDSADIVVTNALEDTLRALGADYDTLASSNPRLVYVQVSGYGPLGPDAARSAFDTLAMAESGMLWALGHAEPRPFMFGIGDQQTATIAALGALAGLAQRQRTGQGSKIETSLYAAMLQMLNLPTQTCFALDKQIYPQLRSEAYNPLATWYECSDGLWIFLADFTPDATWIQFCLVIGMDQWVTDEHLSTMAGRGERSSELIEAISDVIGTRPSAHWAEVLRDAGLAVGVLRDPYSALHDPRAVENGLVGSQRYRAEDGDRTFTCLGSPFRIDGRTHVSYDAAPVIGEHSIEILRELGLDDDELDELTNR